MASTEHEAAQITFSDPRPLLRVFRVTGSAVWTTSPTMLWAYFLFRPSERRFNAVQRWCAPGYSGEIILFYRFFFFFLEEEKAVLLFKYALLNV